MGVRGLAGGRQPGGPQAKRNTILQHLQVNLAEPDLLQGIQGGLTHWAVGWVGGKIF